LRASAQRLRRRASQAVSRFLHEVRPEKANLRKDAVAGLTGSVGAVPDGMANSLLVGVSPIHGLYASFAGRVAGGLSTSSALMVVTTTSAASLAAGSAISRESPANRPEALFLLALLTGVIMVLAGAFRLGRFARFVTQSVMIGFLSGVALNIIFSQLEDLVGADADGPFPLANALDVIAHPGSIDLASLGIGLLAMALLAGLLRTRIGPAAPLIALVLPTLLVVLLEIDSVIRVSDAGDIPSGFPTPHVPELRQFSIPIFFGAFAVAAIVLVQGAGVSEASPNPDGKPSSTDRDFVAQGVGSVASGIFRGMPVGGSVGSTALNVSSGAVSRWGAILSGLGVALILVAFAGVVGRVAVPTLAAILIFASISALRVSEAGSVWRTGPTSKVAMVTTFVATLFLPVAAAVGLGVALTLLLQLNQEASELKVVELYRRSDGRFAERDAPAELRSHDVIILTVYGSLLYAGARTLQTLLPDPTPSDGAAVVLRLRGRLSLGSTFFLVLEQYADRVNAAGGRLLLTGLDRNLIEQIERTGRAHLSESVELFPATPVLLESTERGLSVARAWVREHAPETKA
jgi:SulP family sulfate permease